MESGRQAQGDVLQVIGRPPPGAAGDGIGSATGSIRLVFSPERRRKLSRIVFATLAGCGVILLAAAVVHVVRPSNDASAYASTAKPAPSAAAIAPVLAPQTAAPPAAPATPDAPQTGTVRLLKPAAPGKVWLDGQKLGAATATVACGSHQLKIGAHGKAHAVDVPCGGELKVSR